MPFSVPFLKSASICVHRWLNLGVFTPFDQCPSVPSVATEFCSAVFARGLVFALPLARLSIDALKLAERLEGLHTRVNRPQHLDVLDFSDLGQ